MGVDALPEQVDGLPITWRGEWEDVPTGFICSTRPKRCQPVGTCETCGQREQQRVGMVPEHVPATTYGWRDSHGNKHVKREAAHDAIGMRVLATRCACGLSVWDLQGDREVQPAGQAELF